MTSDYHTPSTLCLHESPFELRKVAAENAAPAIVVWNIALPLKNNSLNDSSSRILKSASSGIEIHHVLDREKSNTW